MRSFNMNPALKKARKLSHQRRLSLAGDNTAAAASKADAVVSKLDWCVTQLQALGKLAPKFAGDFKNLANKVDTVSADLTGIVDQMQFGQ